MCIHLKKKIFFNYFGLFQAFACVKYLCSKQKAKKIIFSFNKITKSNTDVLAFTHLAFDQICCFCYLFQFLDHSKCICIIFLSQAVILCLRISRLPFNILLNSTIYIYLAVWEIYEKKEKCVYSSTNKFAVKNVNKHFPVSNKFSKINNLFFTVSVAFYICT